MTISTLRVFPKKVSILITVLTLVAKLDVSQSEQKIIICPIQLKSYQDLNCNEHLSSQLIQVNGGDDDDDDSSSINSSNCYFIEDGLYKIKCKNASSDDNGFDNDLQLSPCFGSSNPFIQTKYRSLNQCHTTNKNDITNRENIIKSYTFHGSCKDVTPNNIHEECTNFDEETTIDPTDRPITASPTPEPAASIILPTPPLPKNSFADDTILDPEIAHECVYLAGKFIYSVLSAEEAQSNLPSGYTFHSFYDKGSTEAMVISSDHRTTITEQHNDNKKKLGKIIVIFRGTDDTLDGDWLTNINLPKVNFGPKGRILSAQVMAPGYFGIYQTHHLKVHRGFNGVFNGGLYDDILNDIRPLLQRRDEENDDELYFDNTVHFWGHSLGGANAQLFATYFAFFHSHIKTYVTTLGAPRQGNYAYKILVESLDNLSVWRLVNCRDIVPRVPVFQYYHGGHLMWKRCDPPGGSSAGGDENEFEGMMRNDVVEAYYRQSGDNEQKLVKTPSEFIVNQYEDTMISDHFGDVYLEWLEYANGFGNNKNWTTYFQSESNITGV